MPKVYRNNELERRLQERMFIRIAKAHETRIRRELARQYNAAASAIADGRGYASAIGDKRLGKIIAAMMADAYGQFGQRTMAAIEETQGPKKRAVTMDPVFEEALGTYIRKYTARKVKEIDDTTRARIALAVKHGEEEGLTNREIAASIRELGLTDPMFRSYVIARTETHSAANAANLESAMETGVVLEKEWISTEDERTRDGENGEFDHTNVANAKVDEPFIVSGEELMFPGDPNGSAGNIINCRCAMGYVV